MSFAVVFRNFATENDAYKNYGVCNGQKFCVFVACCLCHCYCCCCFGISMPTLFTQLFKQPPFAVAAAASVAVAVAFAAVLKVT